MKITDHDRITDIQDNDVMLVDGDRGTKIATILTLATKVLSKLNLTLPLPIKNGGTGATTAANARNALGLGNTTGALPIANGGTGATSRLAAAQALTNENVGTAAGYFVTLTSKWGKFGYSSAADARTALGLGLPIPLKNGGTGATAAAAARTNLGLGAAATYGVTSSVTSGSTALVTSGGVYKAIPAVPKVFIASKYLFDKNVKDTDGSNPITYTATENCFVSYTANGSDPNSPASVYVDNFLIAEDVLSISLFLKTGQVIKITAGKGHVRILRLA